MLQIILQVGMNGLEIPNYKYNKENDKNYILYKNLIINFIFIKLKI